MFVYDYFICGLLPFTLFHWVFCCLCVYAYLVGWFAAWVVECVLVVGFIVFVIIAVYYGICGNCRLLL